MEAGASPFDIDKILNDLHDEIDGIEDFTNEEKEQIEAEQEQQNPEE